MQSARWQSFGAVVLAVALAAACSGGGSSGGGGSTGGPPPPVGGGSGSGGSGGDGGGGPVGGGPGGGGVDAGADGGLDAGPGSPTDAGPGASDGGGVDGGSGGAPDAGSDGGVAIVPTSANWDFYGSRDGLPGSEILGASVDDSGNLWVAAGTNGVYVLRADGAGVLPKPGAGFFEHFTLADGLHPYGYMADGSPADTSPYLNAISISGGPSHTAFVGYQGKPPYSGAVECEDNWDGPNPDPTIYKSGDADKLVLDGTNLNVIHYDIFSGPNVVSVETRGREKLCSIFRVVYQRGTNHVWFGGNHGFAMGFADFAGDPHCDGQLGCTGVYEHVHPAINGYENEVNNNCCWLYTGDYYGVAPDPATGDVWFGGIHRSTRFHIGSHNYWDAQVLTEASTSIANRIDVWPDLVPEQATPRPSQMVRDYTSAMAAQNDGSVWIGSSLRGLAHVTASETVDAWVTAAQGGLKDDAVGALATDPKDGSLWIGYRSGHGVSRMAAGKIVHYDSSILGGIGNSSVWDIQTTGNGKSRRVIVAFHNGEVGVFSGD